MTHPETPDSKYPGPDRRKRRRRDFDSFANTHIAEEDPSQPDLDVTSSGFGGYAAPPEELSDLWEETSSARRWRHTLWLAVLFGVVVGSAFTTAVFLFLPGAMRIFFG